MARPRKPTNLLRISGAFKKHPERLADRANEPTDIPELGDPPAFLSGAQREAWEYLITKAIAGVIKASDEPEFCNLCDLWSKFLVNSLEISERKQMSSLFGRFGMNPSERSKVSAGDRPKANKFAAIG